MDASTTMTTRANGNRRLSSRDVTRHNHLGASSIGHLPPDAARSWSFDESVTGCFEDMLARSIPQYDVMRRAVTEVGVHYAQQGTTILDLGCSRGDALAPFISRFGPKMRYYGVEVSEPMLAAARARFAGLIKREIVAIESCDLRTTYPAYGASLTLSVLTLMFTPIEYRQRIIRNAYRNTLPGGALILVEKVLGASAEIDELLVERYYQMKAANGYSEEEIQRKRLALEGVQVCVTAAWNEELLRMAGFRQIDCFWRWMNFAAWVAVRE